MALRLAIDVLIYLLLCGAVTAVTVAFPATWFAADSWLFRPRSWERGGRIYQDLLRVRSWKTRLPELADFIPGLFPKKRLEGTDPDQVGRYLAQSRKAELTHWCIVASTVVFAVGGRPWDFAFVLVLALLTNIPFVIIQRYNRPRLARVGSGRQSAPHSS